MSKAEYAKLVASLQRTLEDLQATVSALREDLAIAREENAQLRKMAFGQRRERIKPIERAVARTQNINVEDKKRETQARRKETAEKLAALPEIEVPHNIADEAKACKQCTGPFRRLNEGEISYEYEYVPGRFIRRRHVRERQVCRCGSTIIVGPPPTRVGDGVKYGPGLHAHVAVAKCADSIPVYRLAKSFKRAGVPTTASNLNDIFHRTAELLSPLAERIMQMVAACGYVNADETPVRVMAKDKTRRAYAWAFLGDGQVAYRYSPSRSGETPKALLNAYHGYLQVDNYTGYSNVCAPTGWIRVGCMAHVRRYFFDAQQTEPEAAQHAMAWILSIYHIEYAAAHCLGTPEHLAMRRRQSRLMMKLFYKWLRSMRDRYRPKSPIGKAIAYALNGWKQLCVFLTDPKLKLDNNASERALRVVALGLKNFMFVGNDQAGRNLAVLQTLVGCCEMPNVNPQAYLSDVLLRIQDHPAVRLDELLPREWKAVTDTADENDER